MHQYRRYDIGNYTYGEPTVINYNDGGTLKIGRFCSMATHILMVIGGVHFHDFFSHYAFEYNLFRRPFKDSYSKGDLIIENDVWIASGATLLSGFTVGNGAIVAARSVVTKDVAPYAVVAGNPAREIRKRFDEETIEKLLEIQWWNWDIEKVKEHYKILKSRDMSKLIEISQL